MVLTCRKFTFILLCTRLTTPAPGPGDSVNKRRILASRRFVRSSVCWGSLWASWRGNSEIHPWCLSVSPPSLGLAESCALVCHIICPFSCVIRRKGRAVWGRG